jgi:hypothetical protein
MPVSASMEDNCSVALATSILLLAAIVSTARFVYSRFRAASDLPEDDPDDGDDPHSGVPVQRKGGPKGKVAAAEVEEPDDF